MKQVMVIFILIFLGFMLFPCTVQAQQRKFTCDWSDVAFGVSSGMEHASSLGQFESNPLLRNKEGKFSPAKGIAMRGGLWGGFKLIEWKWPKTRKNLFWAKIALSGFFTYATVHNLIRR